jgi:hypothetical protein
MDVNELTSELVSMKKVENVGFYYVAICAWHDLQRIWHPFQQFLASALFVAGI